MRIKTAWLSRTSSTHSFLDNAGILDKFALRIAMRYDVTKLTSNPFLL